MKDDEGGSRGHAGVEALVGDEEVADFFQGEELEGPLDELE
jgi:hypothetical protein